MRPTEDMPPPRTAAPPLRHDPDFDPPTRFRELPPPSMSQEYQRLVANPFLSLAVLFSAIALGERFGPEFLLALVVLPPIAVGLLHYHCRDCGRTGWLFTWRNHRCAAVVARQRSRAFRRFRGPKPTTQLLLWFYAVAIAAAFAALNSAPGRR